MGVFQALSTVSEPPPPRAAILGCQSWTFGPTVEYGLYAPLVAVKFSRWGCRRRKRDSKSLAMSPSTWLRSNNSSVGLAGSLRMKWTDCLWPLWFGGEHDGVLVRGELTDVVDP